MVITSDTELNNFPASYVANVGDIIAIGINYIVLLQILNLRLCYINRSKHTKRC